MSVEASLVMFPRFTTLAGETTFRTVPIDVSSYSGAQFQVWRGPFRTSSGTPTPKFTVKFEESLDTQSWVLGPSIPQAHEVGEYETKFFSYSFRLRWFRLAVELTGASPIVTCWSEGFLRGGGSGAWGPWMDYSNAAGPRVMEGRKQLTWSEMRIKQIEDAYAAGTGDLYWQNYIAGLGRSLGQGQPFA